MNGIHAQRVPALIVAVVAGCFSWAVAEDARPQTPRRQAPAARPQGPAEDGEADRPSPPSSRALHLARVLSSLDAILDEPEKVAEIGLSAEQVGALKEGVARMDAELTQLRGALQAAGGKQALLITAETPDEAEVMRAVEEAGRIRTEIAKLHVRKLLLARKTLSREQIRRIAQIRFRSGRPGPARDVCRPPRPLRERMRPQRGNPPAENEAEDPALAP
jgi:hypothetical protein